MFIDYENRAEHQSCPICHAELSIHGDRFCLHHKMPFDAIRTKYQEWEVAYASLTKRRFLEVVARNTNSGEWVVEVARYLLEGGLEERF